MSFSTTPRLDTQGNLCVVNPVDGIAKGVFLTLTGDGLGAITFVGDYTVPISPYYQVPAGQRMYLASVQIVISDNASFNMLDYGGILQLPIGVTIFKTPAGGSPISLLNGRSLKNNLAFFEDMSDTLLTAFSGTDQALVSKASLFQLNGMPIILNPGDRFSVTLADNFTGLISQTFSIAGRLVTLGSES